MVKSVINKRGRRNGRYTFGMIPPYETAEYRRERDPFHDYYDDVEICCVPHDHLKAAIQKRNRVIADRRALSSFISNMRAACVYDISLRCEKGKTAHPSLRGNMSGSDKTK